MKKLSFYIVGFNKNEIAKFLDKVEHCAKNDGCVFECTVVPYQIYRNILHNYDFLVIYDTVGTITQQNNEEVIAEFRKHIAQKKEYPATKEYPGQIICFGHLPEFEERLRKKFNIENFINLSDDPSNVWEQIKKLIPK